METLTKMSVRELAHELSQVDEAIRLARQVDAVSWAHISNRVPSPLEDLAVLVIRQRQLLRELGRRS
jgi:hypothetical protein